MTPSIIRFKNQIFNFRHFIEDLTICTVTKFVKELFYSNLRFFLLFYVILNFNSILFWLNFRTKVRIHFIFDTFHSSISVNKLLVVSFKIALNHNHFI